MSETVISSIKSSKANHIIPGAINILSTIELNIDPVLSNPTTLVINYLDNGVVPTGNRVTVYKLVSPIVQLPILGSPILDVINKTLTVIVPAGYINETDKILVEFETKIQ
ncbi:MAG: hypothetical protein ACRC92_25485 [Peptostreptococcaceae bacterium]